MSEEHRAGASPAEDEVIEEVASSKKKKNNLLEILPSLLKFVAIGLAAFVVVVCVSVITYNVLNGNNSKGQTLIPENSPYVGTKPQYSYSTIVGVVRCNTQDATPYSVVVDVAIGYTLNDSQAQTEFIARQFELRDFIRNYFSTKYAKDLTPDKEPQLKQELMELLNVRILDTAKAKNITFNQLSVMEM
ncbi:MAG: flagellar basal body-associated FliL family protein [Treponema sp.]|jgi:flagellar FliL protein|nr:flagellar basal body-associated FliL family protein [Treponema sp.]